MMEFFSKLWHWLFTPDFHAMIERDLADARIQKRKYEQHSHYAELMVLYYQSSIERDEEHFSGVAKAQRHTTSVAPVQQASEVQA